MKCEMCNINKQDIEIGWPVEGLYQKAKVCTPCAGDTWKKLKSMYSGTRAFSGFTIKQL